MKSSRPWQPMQRARLVPKVWPTDLPAEVLKALAEDKPREVWMNDRYVVQVFDRKWFDGSVDIVELSIRRTDRDYPRDWRHFQRIKNEIVGPEREACELFPAESRLVDGAKQFHLWVLPEGQFFPFGYIGARSVGGPDEPWAYGIGGRQRPLEEMS